MRHFQRAAITVLFLAALSGQLGAQGSSGTTIKVEGVWARATPAGSKTGVVYMTLVNNGTNPERLLGGTTSVAEKVEFHSNINDNGVMRMRELTAIDVAPGTRVLLKPSSTHAMLVGLKEPLKEGKSFPLTLEFAKAGKIDVVVSVEKVGALEHRNMSGM